MDLKKLEKLENQQLIEIKTQDADKLIDLHLDFVDYEDLPYLVLAIFERLDKQEKRMVIEQIWKLI